MNAEKCKGFWNMCGCPQCRAADTKLDKDLESGEKTKEQAIAEMITERAITSLTESSKDGGK